MQNFKFLFTSGQLTLLLRNTILYNVAFIVLGNFLQLLFAILLNEVQSKRYKKTTQSMMFLPYFISDVLVSLLVYNLLKMCIRDSSAAMAGTLASTSMRHSARESSCNSFFMG